MLFSRTTMMVLVLAGSVQAADDDLFSSVRNGAVFEKDLADDDKPATKQDKPAATKEDKPVSGEESPAGVGDVGQLSQLLKDGQFQVVDVNADERFVTTTFELSPWTFPVLIVLSRNNADLHVLMGLSVIENESTVTSGQLFKLMEASQEYAPVHFTYSAARKRTELHSVIRRETATSDVLRQEISRLADIAAKSESFWVLSDGKTPAVPPAEKPADGSTPSTDPAPTPQASSAESEKTAAPPTTDVPATTQNLTGQWSAVVSATEAFAAEFKADGTFTLVHVANGKTARSTGAFTLTNNSLTLQSGAGKESTGTISRPSDKEFQFTPANSSKTLTFRK